MMVLLHRLHKSFQVYDSNDSNWNRLLTSCDPHITPNGPFVALEWKLSLSLPMPTAVVRSMSL